jgi:hypothetical protein
MDSIGTRDIRLGLAIGKPPSLGGTAKTDSTGLPPWQRSARGKPATCGHARSLSQPLARTDDGLGRPPCTAWRFDLARIRDLHIAPARGGKRRGRQLGRPIWLRRVLLVPPSGLFLFGGPSLMRVVPRLPGTDGLSPLGGHRHCAQNGGDLSKTYPIAAISRKLFRYRVSIFIHWRAEMVEFLPC